MSEDIVVLRETIMPKKGGTRVTRKPKYPFNDLGVGDAFFVFNPTKTFGCQVTAANKRLGKKFSLRRSIGMCKNADGVWSVALPGDEVATYADGVWRVS